MTDDNQLAYPVVPSVDPGDLIAIKPKNNAYDGTWFARVSMLGGRDKLTADRTYYVRSDGSNSNDGLTNSASGAFKTLQHADDFISVALDLAGYVVTVQIGLPGTYVGVRGGVYHGGGYVYYLGDPTSVVTCNNYIITEAPFSFNSQGCFYTPYPSSTIMALNGMRLQPSNFISCVSVPVNLIILGDPVNTGGNMVLVPCGGGAGALTSGPILGLCPIEIDATGNETIDYSFILSYGQHSQLFFALTILGTLTCTTAFVDVVGGFFNAQSTMTGTGVGVRYLVSLNGVIDTHGGGANYFPGNAPGSATTGGQYV